MGSNKEQSLEAYGQLPLAFEANRGQSDEQVKFISRGSGYGLFLTPTEAVLALRQPATQSKKIGDRAALVTGSKQTRDEVLRLKLIGANAAPQVLGMEELPGKVNNFIGNDPTKWRTDVPTYAKVKYQDVYPGVDMIYYGNKRELEYDLVVAPGADPDVIVLRVEGSRALRLDQQGDLVLKMAGGTVILRKPDIYQEINGNRQAIQGGYTLQSPHQIGFEVGDYDTSRPLVIDPVLVYSTFLGGSSSDVGQGIAVDSGGNAYVTGYTYSSNFPIVSANQPGFGGKSDAFVVKLNPTGNVIYSTHLGGSKEEQSGGIAVDSAGNAYVTGQTISTNFPVVSAFQSTFGGGSGDAFVAKLNANGNGLLYSTYLGGSQADGSMSIAVDSGGSAYITGSTYSTNFPTMNPYQATLGGPQDVFVTKVSASGSNLIYSTYLGGNSFEQGSSITVDSGGHAYITGFTMSNNFPTANPYQATLGGAQDTFVTKLAVNGNGLLYSTYLGGSQDDWAGGIAVDSGGSAYITGSTYSTNFPTMNPYQATLGGTQDAFVAKLDYKGGILIYSTYLGGNNWDWGFSIALDSGNNAHITGRTYSSDFPLVSAYQTTLGGTNDAFVTKLNATGSTLLYSTLLGGNNDDMALAIAVDSGNNAYVTGRTFSNNFPTVNPYQPIFGGGSEDAFVTKIAIQAAATCVEPPNTTMIAWYPFDETVGTTAANLATGNTGTLVNAPIHIPGKVAGALLFNGINDYVNSPSTIVTNIGPAGLPQTCGGGYSTCRGDFSIDAWIKVNSKGSMSVSTIVDKRSGSGSTTKGYSFFVFQQNKLGLHLADGLGIPGFTIYLSPVIPGLADKWHHVAVTVSRRSPTGIQWYDNGVNIGFSDPTVAATSRYGSLANNGPLHIGAANPLSSWFQGEIDELEIFNRALDALEVKAIFDAGDYGKCKK